MIGGERASNFHEGLDVESEYYGIIVNPIQKLTICFCYICFNVKYLCYASFVLLAQRDRGEIII
jgi:hypothetical protein